MDAPTPTPAVDDTTELEALRARAYGPNPDIADDVLAQRRLVELEARARAVAAASAAPPVESPFAPPGGDRDAQGAVGARVAPEKTGPAPIVDAVDVARAREVDSPAAAPQGEAEASPLVDDEVVSTGVRARVRAWLERPRTPWILAGVAGVIAFVVAAGWIVAANMQPRPDVRLDARLDEGPDGESVPFLDQGYVDYLRIENPQAYWRGTIAGIEVWTLQSIGDGPRCLLIDVGGSGGYFDIRCAYDLDPTIDVPWGDGPFGGEEELDIADGSLVRFVWSGDGVDVFIDRAPLDAA